MSKETDIDKRLSLLEQKVDLIIDNHLAHVADDMKFIKRLLTAVMIGVLVEAGYIIAQFNIMQ